MTDKDQAAEISKILKAPRDFVLSQLSADAKQVEFGVYGKYSHLIRKTIRRN